MDFFKKKEIFKVESTPIDPAQMAEPQVAADFIRRGMAYYARRQYDLAEKDLRMAISLDEKSVDACYTLGMVLKAVKDKDGAVKSFQKAIKLIEAGAITTKTTSEMLRRLALGHINEIQIGDWNLEKEIWRHV